MPSLKRGCFTLLHPTRDLDALVTTQALQPIHPGWQALRAWNLHARPRHGMSVALLPCMLAATLIPLMFILALFVLFLFGAWPMGILPSIVVVGLLAFIATGLVRMARASDAAPAAAK